METLRNFIVYKILAVVNSPEMQFILMFSKISLHLYYSTEWESFGAKSYCTYPKMYLIKIWHTFLKVSSWYTMQSSWTGKAEVLAQCPVGHSWSCDSSLMHWVTVKCLSIFLYTAYLRILSLSLMNIHVRCCQRSLHILWNLNTFFCPYI